MRRTGFTLVELVLVILIILLCLALFGGIESAY